MGRSRTGTGRRRSRRRPQHSRFLVACEGKKEFEYFRHLNKRLGGAISIKTVRRWSAPEHVLDLALKERDGDLEAAKASGDPGDAYDGVWIVVDVDEHANLVKTLQKAAGEGVSSAVSAPCFEVWLILHLEDHTAAFNDSQAAKAHWAKLSGLVRTTQQQFVKTDGNFAAAADRAESLLARHRGDGTERVRRNPSSEVGILVSAISKASGVSRDLL